MIIINISIFSNWTISSSSPRHRGLVAEIKGRKWKELKNSKMITNNRVVDIIKEKEDKKEVEEKVEVGYDDDVDHDDDGEGEEDDCDGGDGDDCDEFKAFHYFSLPYALPSSFQEELQHLTIIPLNTNTLSFRQQTNHHHHHRAIGGWWNSYW